jgi:hypothetical protein
MPPLSQTFDWRLGRVITLPISLLFSLPHESGWQSVKWQAMGCITCVRFPEGTVILPRNRVFASPRAHPIVLPIVSADSRAGEEGDNAART